MMKLESMIKQKHFFIAGSTGGEIISVTMENCDATTDDRCEAQKSETVRGQLTFKANDFNVDFTE